MRGPEWQFRRSGNIRDRSNRLRELPRREEGRAPLTLVRAITLAALFLSALHLGSVAQMLGVPTQPLRRIQTITRIKAQQRAQPNPHHDARHDGGNSDL